MTDKKEEILIHLEKAVGEGERPRLRTVFATEIVPMRLGTLRFANPERTIKLSSPGTAISSSTQPPETKAPLSRTWACPEKSILGTEEWAKPLFDFHNMLDREMGDAATFLLPQIFDQGEQFSFAPFAYASGRRLLASMAQAVGINGATRLSRNNPQNFIRNGLSAVGMEFRRSPPG